MTIQPHLNTVPNSYSKTGKAYQFDLHQVSEGDVILWSDKWFTVQTVTRTSALLGVTLQCHSEQHGHQTITGEECRPVFIIPRIFVKRMTSPSLPLQSGESTMLPEVTS